MAFTFSNQEIKEITIAAIVLSVAFAIVFANGFSGIVALGSIPFAILIVFSFIAVGIAFLAHELIGHKLIAQRFGFHAEFKKWNFGLGLALVSSFFGFIFAAPGAVVIYQSVNLWGHRTSADRRQNGLISLGGPATNIVLALLFIGIHFAFPLPLWEIAINVNVWLAIFNMLPIPPLDGSKVLAWDKKIWVGFMALCIAFFVGLGYV